MLKIVISEKDFWDDNKQMFLHFNGGHLELEHSLIAISKWESKYKKPFFSKKEKTQDEISYYIKCMTLNDVKDPLIYNSLSNSDFKLVSDYINDSMTATVISKKNSGGGSPEPITSELIYFWMLSFNVPVEFQYWHINRLMTLLRICSIKNQAPQKHSTSQLLNRNAALNAARRKMLNSKG